jgi:hypothetical protein
MKKTKELILREKYNFVINHFSNERHNLFLQIFKQIYATNRALLKNKQFAQCTLQNRILAELLIKSRQFKSEDIEKKWKPFWGIHQFLIIRVDDKKFRVDPFFRIFKRI